MDTVGVCNQIRKQIKEKGYTQEEFAKTMNVSVATMNRWLRGEGLLFNDLNLIIDRLGLKLSELAMMAEGDQRSQFTYTIEQENAFVHIEGLLAFFDQLLKGITVLKIARLFKLTEKSVNFYLSKLDKLQLIEWLPQNKVKLLTRGEPRWLASGPLSQKFRKQIVGDYIQDYLNNQDKLRIGLYSLSENSSKKIDVKLAELIETARNLEIKDNGANQNLKLTTLILGFGQSEVSLLTKIPNR